MNKFENAIIYHGNAPDILSVKRLWKSIENLPVIQRFAKLPPTLQANFEYLRDIVCKNGNINFSSQFSPNEEVLLSIADHYHVDYMHTWYNAEYYFYGVSFYVNKKLFEFEMEENDYLLYDICEDRRFIFENEYYTDRLEIFPIIIARKILDAAIDFPFEDFKLQTT